MMQHNIFSHMEALENILVKFKKNTYEIFEFYGELLNHILKIIKRWL